MDNRDRYIENLRDGLYKASLVRLCWGGAVLALAAGFIGASRPVLQVTPAAAATAAILASAGMLSWRAAHRDIAFHRALGLAVIAVAAVFLEILSAGDGATRAVALAGQVLLIVAAMGSAPSSPLFYAAGTGVFCVVSFVPPLVLHGSASGTALLSKGLLIPVLGGTLAFRLFNDRSLQRELSRSFDFNGSDGLYRKLFEQAGDALFIADADLRYIEGNPPSLERLGYSREDLQRLKLTDLLPAEQASRLHEELRKCGDTGSVAPCEGKMRTKDGRWLDVEVRPIVMGTAGATGRWFLFRDVTERKAAREAVERSRSELERNVLERTLSLSALNDELEREIGERRRAEQRIVKQLDRLRALSTVERAIASSLDPGRTLSIFIDQVMGQLGADAAAVMLYDHASQELAFAAARGFRSSRIMKVRVKAGRSLAGTVIARRTRIAIADMERPDARYPPAEGYDFKNSFMVKDEGFRSYIGVPLTVKGVVKGTLEVFHRKVFEPESDWLEFLDALSQQASIAIDHAEMYAALSRSHAEISLAYDKTIEGWSRALDIRDNETHGHSQRVAELTVRLARRLGIGDAEIAGIRRGALLHDIGKLGVPDSILLKPGKLTTEEMAVMKRHPEIAFDILAPIPFLKDSLDIPYLHHEKWDGTGYPRGLRGEDIPVAARIFAVIDVWDALRSDRPYREAWGEERVRDYLTSERARHFDPVIVEQFLREVPGAGSRSPSSE